ncbi:MAG: hypothetical protein JST01_14440 [Cyanobacteria bacterium SZAS TMP-1]|nr:hypothetical protein [Cyanobacteria bacterium SZAS TMP-1]
MIRAQFMADIGPDIFLIVPGSITYPKEETVAVPPKEIKTREQLDAAFMTYYSLVQEGGPDEAGKYRRAVLDAVFPKPESERLKKLKEARRLCAGVLNPAWTKVTPLLIELINKAIREEEAK